MKAKLHRAIAKSNPWNMENDIELSIVFKNNESKLFCLCDNYEDEIEIKELDTYTNPTFKPSIFISLEKAQELCDSLWNIGIRPIAAKGSAGQLTAVQYHLEDMRKLVFQKKELIP